MGQEAAPICPYCGANASGSPVCSQCGGLLDEASRAATAAEIGPWFVRDESRPFFPGCSLVRLRRMIQDGQLRRESIIRGPTTSGFWVVAAKAPGVARLLGCCHHCEAEIDSNAQSCPRCSTALSIEHQATAAPSVAGGAEAASAIDLIKHAQYRRIERLQSFVRLQAIGLAVLAGGLFVVLVVFLTGLLEEQPTQPPTMVSESTPQAEPILPVEAIPPPPPPSVPTKVDQLQPESPAVSEPVNGPATQNSLAAQEALENIRRTMSKVTPEQAALLGELRVLLEGAERSSSPVPDRLESIYQAQQLIDDALTTEKSEFFRLRLQALRGEFEKARARLDAEASMGS